jgi:nitrile hydratase beta subunit
MNGLHDMGGMHGFGKVEVEKNEPVFHRRWQARVFGIVQALGGANIDAGRHSIERLDPVTYLRNGYYGRWFAALERGLVAAGVLQPEDISRRARDRTAAAPAPGGTSSWRPRSHSFLRDVERLPTFRVGQAVVTKNHQSAGHTRLPGYGRCRRGVVVRVHPAMVYPDDNAHWRGENPQFLYTVRFESHELWGDGAEANAVVHIDLFEPYLEAGD